MTTRAAILIRAELDNVTLFGFRDVMPLRGTPNDENSSLGFRSSKQGSYFLAVSGCYGVTACDAFIVVNVRSSFPET